MSTVHLQVGTTTACGAYRLGRAATVGICLKHPLQLRRQPLLPIQHVRGTGMTAFNIEHAFLQAFGGCSWSVFLLYYCMGCRNE